MRQVVYKNTNIFKIQRGRETENLSGKIIKIKGFPRDKKVKIFWE